MYMHLSSKFLHLSQFFSSSSPIHRIMQKIRRNLNHFRISSPIILIIIIILVLAAVGAQGRILQPQYPSDHEQQLISDGLDHDRPGSSSDDREDSSLSVLKLFINGSSNPEEGPASSDSGGETKCEQMYGFLPCSETVGGHLFLILVYEYLLFHGESYVATGGERIFKILGPGVFGASAFHILGFLPEALIVLASGLLYSKEEAQEFVSTGVGLLAGSTILLLSVVWGTCVLVGSQEPPRVLLSLPSRASNHRPNRIERFFSQKWIGPRLRTDWKTCYTARIMVLSVIPFILIQTPTLFHLSSSGETVIILITLSISVVFLLAYFLFQFFQPWVQRRRLEYVKHEHLTLEILKHLQNHAMGKLFTSDGAPNTPAIRRLFQKTDNDGDAFISSAELKGFLQEIRFRKMNHDKDKISSDIMAEFDLDNDDKITVNEFVKGITKWLSDTRHSLGREYHTRGSLKELYEVLQPWIEKRKEEREMMKHLSLEIFRYLQASELGSLLKEDGTPDIPAIKRLFEAIDIDKDHLISRDELKQLVMKIKLGSVPFDPDEAVTRIIKEFDRSKDEMIDEQEFISGLSKWLHLTSSRALNAEESDDDIYQEQWEQTDKLLEEAIDRSPLAWAKALLYLGLGIFILGVLAEPLIDSVKNFSNSVGCSSFFVSFMLVPLATNARIAIIAIKEARRKTERISSLTFSEIYAGVFMNNMLGFSVLLSLIYFRGLSWDFSAEVLIVLVVCVVMGSLTSLSSVFPVWLGALAYLLYPLSLISVYIFDNVLGISND